MDWRPGTGLDFRAKEEEEDAEFSEGRRRELLWFSRSLWIGKRWGRMLKGWVLSRRRNGCWRELWNSNSTGAKAATDGCDRRGDRH